MNDQAVHITMLPSDSHLARRTSQGGEPQLPLPPLEQTPPTSPKEPKNGTFNTITSRLSVAMATRKFSRSGHVVAAKGRSDSISEEEALPPISPGVGVVNQRKISSIKSPEPTGIEGFKPKTHKEFKQEFQKAKSSGDYKKILAFYETTFSSFAHLNMTFKTYKSRHPDDCGISLEYLHSVYKYITDLPQDIQKITLKGIINSLLKDMKKPGDKYDLRAYLMLLQNPQFNQPGTYVIFAHLLRQIANLCDQEHACLVSWFRRLSRDLFLSIVERLQRFLSIRLFPPDPSELPPIVKCSWWIPSVTKVLALFNAANKSSNSVRIPYTALYNSTLDNLDLTKEYQTWQKSDPLVGFTFCQYPFLLSIQAKRTILQKDSEQQMIMTAKRSLVATVQQRQRPNMNQLFLNLRVRRSHLVSDSLHVIANKTEELKKKLRVSFIGEPGLDMGGLTKEWFLLLLKKIFREEYGMFVYNRTSHCFWINPACTDCYQEYNLVGVLMGLAVYNSIILDIRFPPVCYRKLLSPAVVPYSAPMTKIGNCDVTLGDLNDINPELARGLKELLAYEGNVEEDLCTDFQISIPAFGSHQTVELKPNGANIPVTNENRKEYVSLYVKYIFNKSVYKQFAAFYHGFHSVCASNALIMLQPQEVEMLVCGSPDLNLDALEKVTRYEGYVKSDPTIRYFWEICKSFPRHLQKKLLLFATGSDRIPIGGMGEMTFKIIKVITSTSMLPMSHTCFNQLILPPYRSRRQLKQKLTIAISNAEGFGLE